MGYDLQLDIRPVRESDLSFIQATWKAKVHQLERYQAHRRCKKCGGEVRGPDKNWFFAAQAVLIDHLLRRSSVVLVACSVRNDDQLYGYLVGHQAMAVLHWLFTKDGSGRGLGAGYRRAGVAQRLMEAAFPYLGERDITASFRTPVASKLPARWRLRFDTHALLEVTP